MGLYTCEGTGLNGSHHGCGDRWMLNSQVYENEKGWSLGFGKPFAQYAWALLPSTSMPEIRCGVCVLLYTELLSGTLVLSFEYPSFGG